ncbi:MBL fold metallo-hydrolase [Granulicella sibirica]|uniref:Outer membrane protein romA n=1 Tax=Granulicella sibirica TaxID=2479048 RepID=A0A4Q0T2R8_9BACT|nr:MBL fold metallo-hydrolase [Granulicella sibirica]RXH57913.1 Outer membrane protein romA [Granulicella sibirica]
MSLGTARCGAHIAGTKQATGFAHSPQWRDGRFENAQPIWADTAGAWKHLLFGHASPDALPRTPVPVGHPTSSSLASLPGSGLRVTWFGHSSALLEIDGSRILIDPFWGERASPLSWFGPRRWYPPLIALNDMGPIDLVLISHDHYDHLDYATIHAMRTWKTSFIVPLGMGPRLVDWGIPKESITELDWWQSKQFERLTLVATPARHASGRTSTRSDHTLWVGWSILGPQHRVWYSGDSGFHNDLAKIGQLYGPFDLTLIEAGQYDARWPDTHMGPEQAVEAHLAVRGRLMIPVHWGLLSLANHSWTEPAERVLAAAQCRNAQVLIPQPGQSLEPINGANTERWWPKLSWQSATEAPILSTKDGSPSERYIPQPCTQQAAGKPESGPPIGRGTDE